MRFHVLAVPHAVTVPEYSTCAFTQKVLKLCKMLKMTGHHVIFYGHADSKVACDELVPVTNDTDLLDSYGEHDWRKGWPDFKIDDPVYTRFNSRTIQGIAERKQPGDFLLCPFGWAHRVIAECHPDLIAVESGIGYSDGSFAKYRVFESYAAMHAYYGQAAIKAPSIRWYDAVIPNAFDEKDFTYSDKKIDYLLFLGRVNDGKGFHIAREIAETTKTKLLVAGPGACVASKYVKPVGVVAPRERAMLLSRARAVLCPSTFLEPFCGVQIEAMLSGTPVISSDFGAFTEYNLHGQTGYRCRTFAQFTWAVKNIDEIRPAHCRAWASKFTLDEIAPRYDEYFKTVKDIYGGKGWYEPREPHHASLMTNLAPEIWDEFGRD